MNGTSIDIRTLRPEHLSSGQLVIFGRILKVSEDGRTITVNDGTSSLDLSVLAENNIIPRLFDIIRIRVTAFDPSLQAYTGPSVSPRYSLN